VHRCAGNGDLTRVNTPALFHVCLAASSSARRSTPDRRTEHPKEVADMSRTWKDIRPGLSKRPRRETVYRQRKTLLWW
jgi:hypothetical protein